MRREVASREREGIIPFCSALRGPIWSTAPRSGAPSRREKLKWLQRRASKMITGLEHLFCEDRLTKLGSFSLEKAPQ